MTNEKSFARKIFGDAKVDEMEGFCARVDAEIARRREPVEDRYRRLVIEIADELQRLNGESEGWDANGSPV